MSTNHESNLLLWGRNMALLDLKREEEHSALRAELVEKYGEAGVAKVEARESAAAEKAHSEGRFLSKAGCTAWESECGT